LGDDEDRRKLGLVFFFLYCSLEHCCRGTVHMNINFFFTDLSGG